MFLTRSLRHLRRFNGLLNQFLNEDPFFRLPYFPFDQFDQARKYRLMLNVEQFNPRDLDVKIDGNKVKITAHKSSSSDNWKDSTHIIREYDIPEDVDASTIKTGIDSGILIVEGDRRVTGEATESINDKEYNMSVDLNGFTSKDITLKIVGEEIVVEAKQEIENMNDKDNQSRVSRHWCRRFVIPENVDPHSIKAKFSSDGRLTISAAFTQPPSIEERKINILTD